jgi:hypothetical protein
MEKIKEREEDNSEKNKKESDKVASFLFFQTKSRPTLIKTEG